MQSSFKNKIKQPTSKQTKKVMLVKINESFLQNSFQDVRNLDKIRLSLIAIS